MKLIRPAHTAAVAVAILCASGCAGISSHPGTTATHAKTSASSAAPAAVSGTNCTTQLLNWRAAGASSQLGKLSSYLSKVTTDATTLEDDFQAGADTSADETALATDTGDLAGEAEVMTIKNPPPSCVPGFAKDFSASLNDAVMISLYAGELDGSVNKNDSTGVAADTTLMNTSLTQMASDMSAADSDLTSYESSGAS